MNELKKLKSQEATTTSSKQQKKLHSMNTPIKDLLNEQTSADQADNSGSNTGSDNKNWQRIQLQQTPFWIVGNHEQGFNIIMGKWKLTQEPLFTIDTDDEPTIIHEAQNWLDENQYNVILSMIICAITDINKLKQN